MANVASTWNVKPKSRLSAQPSALTVRSAGDAFGMNLTGNERTVAIVAGRIDGDTNGWRIKVVKAFLMAPAEAHVKQRCLRRRLERRRTPHRARDCDTSLAGIAIHSRRDAWRWN